jgi:aconitate hydratase 2/2-methylisocitrate dehydratase
MLAEYKKHEVERQKQGLPPLPLNAEQTASLIELIKKEQNTDTQDELLHILSQRIPAGVDQAAFVKAAFLNDVANEKIAIQNFLPNKAIDLLGTMLGGYNVQALVDLLKTKHADRAVRALSKITLIFDAFYDVEELHKSGNKFATNLIQSWANAEWFTKKK